EAGEGGGGWPGLLGRGIDGGAEPGARQGPRPLVADQPAPDDGYAQAHWSLRSSGTIRRRVKTSLRASRSRRAGRLAQSSQTALSRRPLMPSLAADARNTASYAPYSSGTPPSSRCRRARWSHALHTLSRP